MRIAYADPPYLGCSHFYAERQEVDHKKLIEDLQFGKPHYDAWALSCSVPSLGILLDHYLIKDSYNNGVIRVAAWVKPFASFKPNVNPAYAWEPVIFKPAHGRFNRELPTVRDWVSANITIKKGLVGAKPTAFCYWLFQLLGARNDDEFHDLYPGTGIVSKCWTGWCEMQSKEQSVMNFAEIK
jgi:hypothetical protein